MNTDQLIEDNMWLVESACKKIRNANYKHALLSEEDMYQEGCLHLVECARRFKAKNKAKFHSFAFTRIRGCMIDSIRKWLYHRKANVYKLKEQPLQYDQMEDREALEFFIDNKVACPVELAIYKEIEQRFMRRLSNQHKSMLLLKLQGYLPVEISRKLKISESRVSRCFKEMATKFSEMFGN